MAELAAGAVSSLLIVIRNEALLLGGVRDDVQFIKEEMESMNSFLAHLARNAPPGGDHNEQVRTWMNQVRLLAQDCNNCIDLYLYRGNPDIHRAKGRVRRYLWWVYWFLLKLDARHRAAIQLRQLKDRARDVGERRLRYGVEVPGKSAAGLMPSSSAKAAAAACGYAEGDDGEDSEDQLTQHSGRRAFFQPRTLADHVKVKLLQWFDEFPAGADETFSVAIIVEPDTYKEALVLARDTLVLPPTYYRAGYDRDILVNIPAVHPNFLPLRPKEVLYYILRELKRAKSSRLQKQGIDQAEGDEDLDSWQDHYRKFRIYRRKKRELSKIKRNINKMKIYEKLDQIKSDIQDLQQKGNQQQLLCQDLGLNMGVDKLDLNVSLHMLLQSQKGQLKHRDMRKLPAWDDNIIMKIAKKLKEHMEAEEKAEELTETMGVEENAETVMQDEGAKYEEREQGQEMKNEEENKEQENGGRDESKKENDEKVKEKGRWRGDTEKRGGRDDEEKEVGVGDKRKEEASEDEGKERKGAQEEEHEGKNEEKEQGAKGEEKEVNDNDDEEEEEEDNSDNGKDDEEEDSEDKDEEEEEEDDDEEEYSDDEEGPIHLHEDQYAQILREVFPKIEEQNIQIIQEAKHDVNKEPQEDKPDKNQATDETGVLSPNEEDDFKEIVLKIEQLKHKLKEQLKINRIVDKIKHYLKGHCPLIILKVDEMMDGSRWDEVRQALSLLNCSADALIFTTTKSNEQAKGYYHPPREPIHYSLVGLYHDMVLELTCEQKNEENYSPHISHDILEECFFSTKALEESKPHEFCMKIFTHALYANPKTSNEELIKLHSTLQTSAKSFNILAKKMFMFSYNDLPKEYKSCLLYLAIFPKGQKIKRSTLIARWVAEGLTLKEDWPSSVCQAHRCFDVFICRWLVYPADIGATGKVKSCVVGDLVHGFITTIARKQHFVETRLSHHLARHFSIFNDLQLRSSDRIDKFFQGLSKSSRVSLLKVLDLEGCHCFGGKNQRYLKDICTKMLLLKYLSLRGTNITQLPGEINYLRELEVLDIRETKVPASATTNILLLKLKRLLAGNNDLSSNDFGSVRIPHRIDKMVNIEVLYNVKVHHSHDLKDIGKLWQLRKLGVVIKDQDRHLSHLLRTISDLHECLRSLSITITETTRTISDLHGCLHSMSITTLPEATPHEGTPSSVELPAHIGSLLQHHPKILESLSISGTTLLGHLLPVFTKGGSDKLTEVSLSSTTLNQDDLNILSKLPKLRCVKIRNIACTEGMLTFKEDEFICLKYLLVEGVGLTNITFEDGAACELEKVVLSFTCTGSIYGVDELPKLEEVELHNSFCGRLLSDSFDNAEQIAKLTLSGTLLKQDALQILAKKPNIRCLVLLDKSFLGNQNQITFNKDEFKWLNRLDVHCSSITKIVFTSGSAPRIEKIIWSPFASLSGIDNLPRLKDLEFNGEYVPTEVTEAIEKHKNKPRLKHNGPETQG
ncbi:unnamed protein product [Urochloa humidicola]